MLLVILAVKYSASGLIQILLAASCFSSGTAKPCGKISLTSNKLRESEVRPPRQLKCQIKPLTTFSCLSMLTKLHVHSFFTSEMASQSSCWGIHWKLHFLPGSVTWAATEGKPASLPSLCSYLPLIFTCSVTPSSTQFSLQWLNQHKRRCSALLAVIPVQTAVLNSLQKKTTYLMNQFPHQLALSDNRQTCKLLASHRLPACSQ